MELSFGLNTATASTTTHFTITICIYTAFVLCTLEYYLLTTSLSSG
jgi:hypothetical protein